MDIAALSTSLSQMKLGTQVGTSVAKLSMDSAKKQAAGIIKIMEQSVNPHLGRNIDLKL